MPPKVSVIMPNYNCEKYIAEAIESILNQSFTDFEFIIIDDASTDKSWEIIQSYADQDKRIIALRNDKNKHIVYTRNRGIGFAQGEYIAFLDSDDIAHPERISYQVQFMEANKDVGVCGSNAEIIDGKGIVSEGRKFPESSLDCKDSIWFRNPFLQSSVLVRKKCFNNLGLYDDAFRNAEDLDMWVRIGSKFELYNIQEYLIKYRIHGTNSIIKQQKLMIKNTLKIRRKAMKMGYMVSIKGIIFYMGTWCMQFLPANFVLWLFKLIIKKNG